MITFKQTGNFDKTIAFLNKDRKRAIKDILERYAKEAVSNLEHSTPKDSGETANAWVYKIFEKGSRFGIQFYNNNVVEGIPVVILIQYGHGTRNGSFIDGIDFINPTMKTIFEKISIDLWKEVISL